MLSEFTPDDVPQHCFTALCQDPACHAKLGGFHIPCPMGSIIMYCQKCLGVSLFKLEPNQIRSGLIGRVDASARRGGRR